MELDLGDGTRLHVTHSGRRWRIGKDDKLEFSPYPLAENIADVLREGAKLVLVGARGNIYLADEPLALAKRVGEQRDV
ncbi:hypothetical protein, partial [Lactococcus petauri]|uniref:hypothetical protein n=1 Tax=Lactococcus petauri TaxID=1940789 RepID=UPI0021F17BCD